MSTLQNAVGRYREALGLRQHELATRVGITRQTLGAIEAGKAQPSTVVALRLASALRREFGEVFWLTPTPAFVMAVADEVLTDIVPIDGERVALSCHEGTWHAFSLDHAQARGGAAFASHGIVTGQAKARKDGTSLLKIGLQLPRERAQRIFLGAGNSKAMQLLQRYLEQQSVDSNTFYLWARADHSLALLQREKIAYIATARPFFSRASSTNDSSMATIALASCAVGWCSRGQSLTTPSILENRTRVATCPTHCCGEQLLQDELRKLGLLASSLERTEFECANEEEAARAVANGTATAAMLSEPVARAYGLHFRAIGHERHELQLRATSCETRALQQLREQLHTPGFLRELQAPGYLHDCSELGCGET